MNWWKKATEKTQKTVRYESRSYKRYFENYDIRTVSDGAGGTVVRREYVGDYYCRDCKKKELLREKRQILAVYLLTCAAFLAAALQNGCFNRTALVAGAEGLTLLCLTGFLFPLTARLRAGERLVIREYREASLWFGRIGALASGLCCASAVSVLAVLVFVRGEWFCAIRMIALFSVGALGMRWLRDLGKRTKYERVPGKTCNG